MEEITVISLLFTAILALGCLFLILSPLFKWNLYLSSKNHSNPSATEKEVLLTTLNEIEFEYKMDKLSEKDYHELKKQYESKVANVMKNDVSLEEVNADDELLAEVEKEIEEAMRQYKKTKGES